MLLWLLFFLPTGRRELCKLYRACLRMQLLQGRCAHEKSGTGQQQRFRGRHAQTPVLNGIGSQGGKHSARWRLNPSVEQEQGKALANLSHLHGAAPDQSIETEPGRRD
jgi:hypothetical protein